MGSVLHPVGPEQPWVYWSRRALVLVLALVVVVGLVSAVWWAWPGKGPVSAVPQSSSPSPSVQPGSAPASTASVKPSPTATPTPTATTPAAPTACNPATVTLGVKGFSRVKLSGKQQFALTVTNAGSVPCILTVNADSYTLTVKSGKDRIWSTADCPKWLPSRKLTVKPAAAYEFKVTWPLVRSKASCKTTKDALNAGTYVATATFQDEATARQVIQLTK